MAEASADLATGRSTSRDLVEGCLAAIEKAPLETRCAFIRVSSDAARQAADGIDKLRAAGAALSPYAGIPISIKDLFDVVGETTMAGSRVLTDAAPAARDAPVVARLRGAGFVFIGRTNMTEFAYSGLGMNPHYGTPINPWDRGGKRVPGGSSSGAAISVVEGMAHAAIGTDTGGSCRIPAAFTNLVGFKPTARRVSIEGIVPLAPSLDSIGPIARSVACCAVLDKLLSGDCQKALRQLSLSGLRLGAPETVALDGLDAAVSAAFERALSRLSAAGARIEFLAVPEFADVGGMNVKGGFPAAESYAWRRRHMPEKDPSLYDPRVIVRIMRGAEQSAADYLDLVECRRSIIAGATERLRSYDALVLPTVAIVPPRIADLASDDAYAAANMMSLRNTALINIIDGCAVSIPIGAAGDAPVGLMVAGLHGQDGRILDIAASAERELAHA